MKFISCLYLFIVLNIDFILKAKITKRNDIIKKNYIFILISGAN